MRIQEMLRQSDCLTNITIDQVLFESSYPILFSGYDNNNIYLFICHSVNSERMSWIVTKTTYDIIISLLNNKITIRDAFLGFTTEKILLSFDKEGMHTTKCNSAEIDDNILPTPGQYMDAEEGEFDEEIEYYETQRAKKTSTTEIAFRIVDLYYNKQFDYTPTLFTSYFDSVSKTINLIAKMLIHFFYMEQSIENDSFLVDCNSNLTSSNVRAYSKEIKYECQCL